MRAKIDVGRTLSHLLVADRKIIAPYVAMSKVSPLWEDDAARLWNCPQRIVLF